MTVMEATPFSVKFPDVTTTGEQAIPKPKPLVTRKTPFTLFAREAVSTTAEIQEIDTFQIGKEIKGSSRTTESVIIKMLINTAPQIMLYHYPLAQLQRTIDGLIDRNLAPKAQNILDKLAFEIRGLGIDNTKDIRAFDRDGRELLIEWIGDHWRIGFGINNADEESGWYIVTDEEYGDLRAYGGLKNLDMHWLVSWTMGK